MAIATKSSILKKSLYSSSNLLDKVGLQDSVYKRSDERYAAIIIADLSNSVSTVAARKVIKSIQATKSNLFPAIVQATTPDTLDADLAEFNLTKSNWTYPSKRGESTFDIKTGMKLSAYGAKDVNKVIACAVSHLKLWALSATLDVPIVVLEHDALFIRKYVLPPKEDRYGIIGLNDPRGATRKANIYLQKILDARVDDKMYLDVPYVDDDQFAPQGLAGNSAYLIFPNAANHLINKVQEVGLWPNDALMCKQFFPFLRQAYPFYTTLQGVASTTQG